MTQKFIPSIGASGYFQVASPFDTAIGSSERYTLKSVRTISDYLAASEDVFNNVYVPNGIQASYAQDVNDDIEILGIQSDRGGWAYIPVTYIKCYPITSGVPYRTVSIVIPIQPMPADSDYSGLLSQLNFVVETTLGFLPDAKVVESSKTLLVSSDTDLVTQAERAVLKSESNPYAQINMLKTQLYIANQKVAALEAFIKTP